MQRLEGGQGALILAVEHQVRHSPALAASSESEEPEAAAAAAEGVVAEEGEEYLDEAVALGRPGGETAALRALEHHGAFTVEAPAPGRQEPAVPDSHRFGASTVGGCRPAGWAV